MQTINDRICEIISVLGIKKTHFADKIHVSQAFTSQICSGVRLPSDRTIADICREFGVNETWLRTGEGEMFVEMSRDEEIAAFMGELLSEESDDFRHRLIGALSRLDENGWEVLEQFANDLLEGQKKS